MEIVVAMRGTVYEQGYGIIAQKVMRDKNLSIKAKAIYAYLSSFAGSGMERTAFPGVKLMMSELGIGSYTTFYKYRNELRDAGYISIEQQKDEKGKYAKCIYYIEAVQKPQTQEPQGNRPYYRNWSSDSWSSENKRTNNISNTNISINNMDGWMGDQSPGNGSNNDVEKAKRKWGLFSGVCEKEGLDERTTFDLWKVYQTHYADVPITHAMAVLRDLLNEQWDNQAKAFYGLSNTEFRNFVGLFHHRMKTANEMAVAIEDIHGGNA